MRKVVLWTSVSLDGYFEGPNRELDWGQVDDELHTHINGELRQMGAFLEGRVTFELMDGYWPTADADPASPASVKEFAAIWRGMPKIVYSRTLERAGGNTAVVREVIPAEIEELKAQPGGDLCLGGADLAATFLAHHLVDEFRIYVHPVVLGAGRPLFQPGGATIPLRLTESRVFANGVVLLRYQVLPAPDADRSRVRRDPTTAEQR